MKYLKTYKKISEYKENLSDEYKENDYVIILTDDFTITELKKRWKIYPYNCAQIAEIHDAYYMRTFDINTNKDIIFWLTAEDIERKATIEEIQEFEILKTGIKYNL